eukprot:Nitzschia sp. Nitz4//scaffold173_size47512//34309//36154//NITZ4_007164-RA/size47512-augustus-gene-0.8-mRNA-1//-1//CDS//3329538820//8484//frame0
MLLVHTEISPSPVSPAFASIAWSSPVALSKPEQGLLQTADENPMEYTLADFGDAFAYARVLLKVLDQVTGPSSPGRVSYLELETGTCLSEEESLAILEEDRAGVITHYVLTQLYEMVGLLTEQPSHSSVQLNTIFYQNNYLIDDWRPLLRILYRPGDPFSQRNSALCLAYILQAGSSSRSSFSTNNVDPSNHTTVVHDTLQSLVSWLTSRLQSSHTTSLGVVTPTLVVLATCPKARVILDQAGGIGYLARHLRPRNSNRAGSSRSRRRGGDLRSPRTNSGTGFNSSSTSADSYYNYFKSSPTSANTPSIVATESTDSGRNPYKNGKYSNVSIQQLYELCFCLWAMTYDCANDELHPNEAQRESIRHHFSRDGAIPALAELIAAAPREKVTRLGVASLYNLASAAPKLFVPEMIACRILPSVELLMDRNWSDPDIQQDLESLHKILSENHKEMTTWEVYQGELETGMLKWGPLHTEQFFKANVRRMEGPKGDFCHVQQLVHLVLSNSGMNPRGELPLDSDEETLAVACYDLGEFVRHYPNGKVIAKKLGANKVVMPLLNAENPDVQRQALLCISKLLVNNWQAVGSS